MSEDQMRDLVKECGFDWQRGYMPLFDDDQTNRYAVLIEAALASQPKPAPVLLTDEEIDQPFIESNRRKFIDRSVARAIESAVHRKNGWGE